MIEFINHLIERNFQNKVVGFIENGSWAPAATRVMRSMLEKCKDLKYLNATVKIVSALNDESLSQLQALADEICEAK
jgi:flavorubredoxin